VRLGKKSVCCGGERCREYRVCIFSPLGERLKGWELKEIARTCSQIRYVENIDFRLLIFSSKYNSPELFYNAKIFAVRYSLNLLLLNDLGCI